MSYAHAKPGRLNIRISAIASNCPPTRKLVPAIASNPVTHRPLADTAAISATIAASDATIIAPCTCGPKFGSIFVGEKGTRSDPNQRRDRHADVEQHEKYGDGDGDP